MLVVPAIGRGDGDHEVLEFLLNLISVPWRLTFRAGKVEMKMWLPDLTTLAGLRFNDFLLLPFFLGLNPVLATAPSITGVNDITEKLLVEICIIEHFWVVFGRLEGSYSLSLAPVHTRAVNHLCPTGRVGERLGDELNGVLEFITGGLCKGIAV